MHITKFPPHWTYQQQKPRMQNRLNHSIKQLQNDLHHFHTHWLCNSTSLRLTV